MPRISAESSCSSLKSSWLAMGNPFLLLVAAAQGSLLDHKRRVVAAEPEGVRDRDLDLGLRRREVVHIGARAVTGDLGQDSRAAPLGVIHVLEHEHHRALTHDKAVAA